MKIVIDIPQENYDHIISEGFRANEDGRVVYKAILAGVQPKMVRWIPVSERLPEDKCKTYLVCSDDGYIATIMYDGNGRWLIDDCKIIAWMPLPDPWKGDDDNADRC